MKKIQICFTPNIFMKLEYLEAEYAAKAKHLN